MFITETEGLQIENLFQSQDWTGLYTFLKSLGASTQQEGVVLALSPEVNLLVRYEIRENQHALSMYMLNPLEVNGRDLSLLYPGCSDGTEAFMSFFIKGRHQPIRDMFNPTGKHVTREPLASKVYSWV